MLFASAGLASVNREWDDKRTLWDEARQYSNEYINTFCVNCTLCLTYLVAAAMKAFCCRTSVQTFPKKTVAKRPCSRLCTHVRNYVTYSQGAGASRLRPILARRVLGAAIAYRLLVISEALLRTCSTMRLNPLVAICALCGIPERNPEPVMSLIGNG